MTTPRFTFRSAHLLMWSSPLLLLVLVFTLTSSPATSKAPILHSLTTTSPPHDTTVTSAPPTTTSSPVRSTPPPTSLVPKANSVGTISASVTDSTAKSTAPYVNANVSNSVLEGMLDPTAPNAVVPLNGPGTWTLQATLATQAQLVCPQFSRNVTQSFVLTSHQTCQLEIAPAITGASLTWQLTRTP